ncbi:hypothetical protein PILCRDRAFT_15096 [Piloderma croceum F 1598]|uniref:Uncharacterized protein n=1 Tax=Piloderma croceum (strain F 1598) TaxID=765440 RepID=A0A0C3B8H4_PILCF|nr:hypothetical protein PILCRDRAFT_15096 [Piloderma croceum F 1598]
MTKATVLARHVGLKRMSINTDQGKGTPFAYTEDVDSSPLADETLKNSEARSPSHEEVIMLSDEERQSKDTDWIKKLEELQHHTEAHRKGNTCAIMYRPSEHCAGKQQQTSPMTCNLHSPTGPPGVHVNSGRTPHGLHVDSGQTPHGLQADSSWTLGGLLMDSGWTPHGLQVDSSWTPAGLLMDSGWTPHGLQLDS